jgi:CBS domain-containing protein
MAAPDDVSALLRRVGDLVIRAAVSCDPATSAAEIAHLMSRQGVGSVVVLSDDRPVGIVTDRDLRRKIVGEGRDSRTTPASALMSSPVLSVPAEAFVVDALVVMTRRAIHHLAVTSNGRFAGVISASDVLRLELPHPVAVSRAIGAANSFDALKSLGPDVLLLTRRLVSAGASALDVGALVAELNDQLVQRVMTLTAEKLAAGGDQAPVPYCWLAFGSEARREQTLRTDQDNGLVYADPPPGESDAAASYYERFADTAVRGLMTVGFPACPGNVMASNPTLCRPLSGWLENFATWMDHPSPSEVLAASIHFDLRPIAGALELGSELSGLIERDAPKHRVFLAMLARDVVSRRPPLSLFGRVAARRGRVDVKGAAAMPFVGAARVHALELGLRDVNTVDRFRAAGARGLYTSAETTEVVEAYQHILRLRLVHQLAQLDRGGAPDNLIASRNLSRGDGLLLREAFRTVKLVQGGLRARFRTDLLG